MFNKIIFLDAPINWQVGFQDPASAVMEGIINFHHDLFFFLVVILIFVVRIMARCIIVFGKTEEKLKDAKPFIFSHAPTLEIIWTIIPAIILLFIAIPSFSLLYSMDEIVDPLLTIKVIGHQWYWHYELMSPNEFFYLDQEGPTTEYENLDIFSFESRMVADEDLQKGQLRLLEVEKDTRLSVPIEINIRLLITSGDVLHSWAVPALGVKLDACPGRLNQTSMYIKRPSTFYGQCSEICGVNHGFMPIVVNGVDVLPEFDIDQEIFNSIYPFFLTTYYNLEA